MSTYNSSIQKHYKKYPWNRVYRNIQDRCNNPNTGNYKYYGAKGVKAIINKDQLKFLWFRDRAYNMEKPSIDRIDNNGHYTINNCRFIELSENCNKDRKIKVIQYCKKAISLNYGIQSEKRVRV